MTARINWFIYKKFPYTKRAFIACLVLLPAVQYCQVQETRLLTKQIEDSNYRYTRERLFVQSDKSFYMPGEIIWMKLYAMDASTHRPINISRVAYVELMNSDGKSVLQGKISMEEGKGNGSFVIPPYLNSGKYLLRAYTNWMKNDGPDHYFEKLIVVFNARKKPEWTDPAYNDSLYIEFFPEGGNLVRGINNTIAFRITDKFGKGVDKSGFVLNQNNDTICRFRPLQFGIGRFSFAPNGADSYVAVLEGYKFHIRFPLPEMDSVGYAMHIGMEAAGTLLEVRVSTNLRPQGSKLFLIGHGGGSVIITEAGNMQEGTVLFHIDTTKLAPGINTFTVFDYQLHPICERLFFKRPSNGMLLQMECAANDYKTRQKIEIEISGSSGSMPVVNGNFSLSVFMADSLEQPDQEDINTFLWLSSELRGRIESPAYYLQGSGNEVVEATDNLMMTHGWRRIGRKTKAQAQPGIPRELPEYTGPLVKLRVLNKSSGLPVAGVNTYLSLPGEHFQFHSSFSDSNGISLFALNNYFGGGEMVFQADANPNNPLNLQVVSPYDPSISSSPIPPLSIPENQAYLLGDRLLHAQARQAFSAGRQQQFYTPENLDTTDVFGQGDKTYLLDDYTRFTTMEEVMREYVEEVMVRKREGKFHFRVNNIPYKFYFDNDPLVLLDGVPVFDVDKIMMVDPLKIKSATVVARNYFLSGQSFDGIVSYKTYKGDLAGFELDPNTIVTDYEGLQLQREFYSPRYDDGSAALSRIPDLRNVLVWEPDIYTDVNGKAHFVFYSSDLPGQFVAVLQGISADGLAGKAVLNFAVHKP